MWRVIALLLLRKASKFCKIVKSVFWHARNEQTVRQWLGNLDITVNGQGPVNVNIIRKEAYDDLAHQFAFDGLMAYVTGLWDSTELEDVLFRIISQGKVKEYANMWDKLQSFVASQNGLSADDAKTYYDVDGNEIRLVAGPTMNYSGAYWKNARNVDEAQQRKMELTAKKLQLSSGMRVLDIGCGWGAFAKFLAETYGVHVVGVTSSVDGAAYATKLCVGLPVRIIVNDWREIKEIAFDRIVCIEMVEHIGARNYKRFYKLVQKCLNDDGIFLQQSIILDNDDMPPTVPWINCVMPDSPIPSAQQLMNATHGLFSIEDIQSFGSDYHRTLIAMRDNFENSSGMPREHWTVELRTSYMFFTLFAAAFRARRYQLWQIVFTKIGNTSPYDLGR